MLGRILAALVPRRRQTVSGAGDRLKLARLLAHSGEYADAAIAYREFLREHPADRGAWLELALTLEKTCRPHDAARACMDAWALDPTDSEVLQHAMRLFDALATVPDEATSDPDADFVTCFTHANIALATGNPEAARRDLERCHAISPGFPFTHQRLGCIDAFAGRLDAANAHFSASRAAGLAPDAYIDLRSAFLDTLDTAGEIASIAAPASGVRAVVFFACDMGYFRRFAHTLVQSLRENAGIPVLVHIHLYNPDQWADDELRRLPNGGNVVRIDTSREVRSFDSKDAAKTYYSSARLFPVADLLSRHGLPVVMLDVDVLVLKSLAPLLDLAAQADCALLRWPRTNWRIWDHVSASTVVFQPGAGAARFARLLAGYVKSFIDRPEGAWYLDQIALFAASARLNMRGVAFVDIPAHWYALFDRDGDVPSNDAVFWSVTANIAKNVRALSGALMRRYQPVTRRAFGWTLPGSDTFFSAILAQAPNEDGKRLGDHALMQSCTQCKPSRRRRAIDIGAHVGFWSEWLSKRFNHVEAFEPDPVMQSCFRENVLRDNVALHAFGLGDADADTAIAQAQDDMGVLHVETRGDDPLRIRRLDDFSFEDVDFVKIDVEDGEARVLRGAEQTLRRCKPLVLIEKNEANPERSGDSAGEAVRLLNQYGASLIAELPDNNCLFAWPD